MEVLGYLLVLALSGNHKYVYNTSDQSSFIVGPVGQLEQSIFKHENGKSLWTLEDIRKGGLADKGEKEVKYFSKSLRDYVLYHNVSSSKEGFVLSLTKLNESAISGEKNADDVLPEAVFIPNLDADFDSIDKKNLDKTISRYVHSIQKDLDMKKAAHAKTKENSEILQNDIQTAKLSKTNIKKLTRQERKDKIRNAIQRTKDLKAKLFHRREKINKKTEPTSNEHKSPETYLKESKIAHVEAGSDITDYKTELEKDKQYKQEPSQQIDNAPVESETTSSEEKTTPSSNNNKENHEKNIEKDNEMEPTEISETNDGVETDTDISEESNTSHSEDNMQTLDPSETDYSERNLEEDNQNVLPDGEFKKPTFDIASEEELEDVYPELDNESSDEHEYNDSSNETVEDEQD